MTKTVALFLRPGPQWDHTKSVRAESQAWPPFPNPSREMRRHTEVAGPGKRRLGSGLRFAILCHSPLLNC